MTTDYIWPLAAIIPAAHLDDGNACLEAMGWGPGNFSVALQSTSGGPVTHYGLQSTCTQEGRDQIEAAQAGTLPEGVDWTMHGLLPTTAVSAFAEFATSFEPPEPGPDEDPITWSSPADHFAYWIGTHGLRRVAAEPEGVV